MWLNFNLPLASESSLDRMPGNEEPTSPLSSNYRSCQPCITRRESQAKTPKVKECHVSNSYARPNIQVPIPTTTDEQDTFPPTPNFSPTPQAQFFTSFFPFSSQNPSGAATLDLSTELGANGL
jgi:hypothetical protein